MGILPFNRNTEVGSLNFAEVGGALRKLHKELILDLNVTQGAGREGRRVERREGGRRGERRKRGRREEREGKKGRK